jgi:aromatic ring-opening dioxygenase catalytic subunit (LigB family)
MSGVIATGVVAHVPTLSRADITPPYQRTLVEGERRLGEKLRALKPDLWVVISTHWVSTFNWFATFQNEHKGVCVADEAPDLIPGIAYRYPGDPEFAETLLDEWKLANIQAQRNTTQHYAWDYGTFVPLSHLDPEGEVAVVSVPVVLMANMDECLRAGEAILAAAQKLNRRAVIIASSALTHALVRGRENWPSEERVAADKRMIDLLRNGDIETAVDGFTEYARNGVVEMGGRAIATMLGATRALARQKGPLGAVQFGEYAQSSGSGNANIVISDRETLAALN